ncbi:hypothetical protein Tco_0654699 [Tanacetum coccineum]|uniref:Uncharacterized protein n=1 Tax=Tanacetum coccineum TaxID=301880 RepID=A0ABQ4X4H4_9ASTR
MPQRLTKSSIYSRSLGLAACASLESKNEVCLLCEVNPKQIPAFDFICASLESILAIEDTWEREEGCEEYDKDEANQRIGYVVNHIVIKEEKNLTIMIEECIWEIGRNV